MSDIYRLHDRAFKDVAAYVVLNGARERVATVAFKFPRDGAGRLYAYVHWIGLEMVRGYACGYGYDKRTAACASAAQRIAIGNLTGDQWTNKRNEATAFVEALADDGGWSWDRQLEARGFTVFQAV
ncbi:hypothetical protein KQX64_17685 [Rhodopseudomonas palustris]|nr:hypothetical protein KQX64_17685 [Rhodopseudomonas palustris]